MTCPSLLQPRRAAALALAAFAALTASCDRGASAGPSPAPSGTTPGAQPPPPTRADTPTGHADPTLGGSTPLGSFGGLAILDPTDVERPFFHDFGKIPRGETRSWVLRLANQDPTPIEIRDARGACGCMRVRGLRARAADGSVSDGDPYATTPPLLVVPVGGILELDLEITTEKVQPNTDKLAVFRVTTSSEASPYLTFEAHLMALDAFMANPAELAFGDVPQGFGGRTKVRILAEPIGSPARILGIAEQGARVKAQLEETFYGGEYVWHLVGEVAPLEPLGAIRDRIVLRTTDDRGEGDAGRLVIPALATVVRDVRLDPPLFALGAVAPGAGAVTEGTLDSLVPGARAKVTGHRFEGTSAAHLTAEFEPLQPDDAGRAASTRVRVRLAAGHPAGPIAARLHVALDDPQNPTASVPVSGVVR